MKITTILRTLVFGAVCAYMAHLGYGLSTPAFWIILTGLGAVQLLSDIGAML